MNDNKWFHTGTNSFDNPRIELLDPDKDCMTGFVDYGFETYKKAKRDLILTLQEDIDDLADLLEIVRELKESDGPVNNPVCKGYSVPDKQIYLHRPCYTYEPYGGFTYSLTVFVSGKPIGYITTDRLGYPNVKAWITATGWIDKD